MLWQSLYLLFLGPPSCTRLTRRACLLAIAYPADYERMHEPFGDLGFENKAVLKLLDVICCGGTNQKRAIISQSPSLRAVILQDRDSLQLP